MTRPIPTSRCRRCVHYDGHICHLDDLQPCRFVPTPEAEVQRGKDRVLAFCAALILSVLGLILYFSSHPDGPVAEDIPAPVAAPAPDPEGLTDWELLQMAIIYTESRFNPNARGDAQDAGLYQMTPVYVREVNRVAGTDYAHADAYDPQKAVEIFAAMQDHYNPDHDPERALHYHNRGAAYRAAVLENLEFIRRYETARKYVTQ